MTNKKPAIGDLLISHFDRALKTLIPNSNYPNKQNPANHHESNNYNDKDKQHIAGLMRVNHTGEVCAQGLYQGQALTAKLPDMYQAMEHAADEEIDHLVWCEERLDDFGEKPSLLNPVWYGLSYMMGAVAGFAGDKYSLGFVAATEERVCAHLQEHLEQTPETDQKTRAILIQMLEDEARHATNALNAGGIVFSPAAKDIMTRVSSIMTKTSYHI